MRLAGDEFSNWVWLGTTTAPPPRATDTVSCVGFYTEQIKISRQVLQAQGNICVERFDSAGYYYNTVSGTHPVDHSLASVVVIIVVVSRILSRRVIVLAVMPFIRQLCKLNMLNTIFQFSLP